MATVDDFVSAADGEIGKSYASHRDCSGLVAWAARQAGFTLPEGSVAQYSMGKPVSRGDVQRGDLVFWDTFGDSPGHVAIADGEGGVIHALNPDRGIVRSDIDANMGGPLVGIRRVVDGGSTDPPKKPKQKRPRRDRRDKRPKVGKRNG